jgi:hypothetical protein
MSLAIDATSPVIRFSERRNYILLCTSTSTTLHNAKFEGYFQLTSYTYQRLYKILLLYTSYCVYCSTKVSTKATKQSSAIATKNFFYERTQ